MSGLGIVFATILGFIIGVARLSKNWLVAKLAAAYVEIFRNIPLLLQILFWYFAVFLNLPPPSEALRVGDSFFLTLRGLYLPRPQMAGRLRVDRLCVCRRHRRVLLSRALVAAAGRSARDSCSRPISHR